MQRRPFIDVPLLTRFVALLIGVALSIAFASAVFAWITTGNFNDFKPWGILTLTDYWATDEFQQAIVLGTLPFIGTVFAFFINKPESLHGDSRWARESDVKAAGLRAQSSKGILLGRFKGRYLMSKETEHFLVCAPTRTGKGVGVIIPNLLNFDGSAIVYDIKFENFEITSGFRAKYGDVFLWAPMNPSGRTHAFNPFSAIRHDPLFIVSDLQQFATIIIPETDPKNAVWERLSQQLFLGLSLYEVSNAEREGREPTIGHIYRLMNSTPDLQAWAREQVEFSWLHDECIRQLNAFAGMNEREAGYTRSGVKDALSLWASPLVDAATSRSDFDLRDLRRKKITIYLGVTADQRDVLRRLVSMFFQQAIGYMSRTIPDKEEEPHRVLLLMDEFASIGKMPMVANAATMLAGYGGVMMFIVQGLSNIKEHYGDTGVDTITQNCRYQVFYSQTDKTTVEYVLRLIGKKTVSDRSSKSRTHVGWTTSMSERDAGRDLMLAQDLAKIPLKKELVISRGAYPIWADKIRYYEDDDFIARLLEPIVVPHVIEDATALDVSFVGLAQHYERAGDEALSPAAQSALSGQMTPEQAIDFSNMRARQALEERENVLRKQHNAVTEFLAMCEDAEERAEAQKLLGEIERDQQAIDQVAA